MNNFLASKKVIWVFVVFGGIAIVVAIMAVSWRQNTLPQANLANTQTKQNVQLNKVDNSKLPNQFPADIPLEAGAKVVDNYNASSPDGRYQATRTFATAKSLDENFKLYQDFFKKNGYTILSSINQPQIKGLLASKGNLKVQVTIAQNTATKVKTVSITVLPQAK